jgi:hypothetical protein
MCPESGIERGTTPRQPAHRTGNVGYHRHVSIRDVKHFTERIHTVPFVRATATERGPYQLPQAESCQKCSDDTAQLALHGKRLNVLRTPTCLLSKNATPHHAHATLGMRWITTRIGYVLNIGVRPPC